MSDTNRTNKKNRSSSTSTRSTSSPVRIQKEINNDYVELAEEYRKLGVSLWRKPAAKYILGGLGLVLVAPYIFKAFKMIPGMQDFLDSSMEEVKEKWSAVTKQDASSEDTLAH